MGLIHEKSAQADDWDDTEHSPLPPLGRLKMKLMFSKVVGQAVSLFYGVAVHYLDGPSCAGEPCNQTCSSTSTASLSKPVELGLLFCASSLLHRLISPLTTVRRQALEAAIDLVKLRCVRHVRQVINCCFAEASRTHICAARPGKVCRPNCETLY